MPTDDDRLRAERARFGENLRSVRERRGMGQRELARLMAARGRAWHQNTVSKTEAGERTPNAFEVGDLAFVLGVTTDRFYLLPEEAAGVAVVTDAHARLSAAFLAAAAALTGLRAARAQAGTALAGHRDTRYARVREACESLEEVLAACTLEDAARLSEEGRS